MTRIVRRVGLDEVASAVADPALALLRADLALPGTPPAEVLADAASATVDLSTYADATDVELVTLDPVGSMDLDQAYSLAKAGAGWLFHYAIADVGAWVRPGGALDIDTHARGLTYYLPDGRVPLHPPVLGEDRASLLPGVERPAVLWTITTDGDANPLTVDVRRARVRSRSRRDYVTEQAALDAGMADAPTLLLAEFGALRQALGRARGAVTLPDVDAQVVAAGADGQQVGYQLVVRAPLALEDHNAEMSLLVGAVAGEMQRAAGVGLLRTLPPPSPATVATLRGTALALGVRWDEGESYATVVGRLQPAVDADLALLAVVPSLLRGSGYTVIPPADGPGLTDEQAGHAAVATVYAHATAPLRRLADRYVSETCLAIHAGVPVPAWVTDGLAALPGAMAGAGHRSGVVDRAVTDLVEALLLQSRVGDVLDAVAVGHDSVAVVDPPVRTKVRGAAFVPATRVRVRVDGADPVRRTVTLAALAEPPA